MLCRERKRRRRRDEEKETRMVAGAQTERDAVIPDMNVPFTFKKLLRFDTGWKYEGYVLHKAHSDDPAVRL